MKNSLLILLALAGCPSPPDDTRSLAPYVADECAWASRCGGIGLHECYWLLEGDDLTWLVGGLEANGLADRVSCVAEATTCDEYLSCAPSLEEIFAGPVDQHVCPGDRESVCTGDFLLWCFGSDGWPAPAGASPTVVVDLRTIGKVCADDQRIIDAEPVECVAGTDSCDGSLLRYCDELGASVTSDCRDLDPEFTCWLDGDQARCGLRPAEPTCPEAGGSARCEGDAAVVCAAGKEYVVDCAAVGARCQPIDASEAVCAP